MNFNEIIKTMNDAIVEMNRVKKELSEKTKNLLEIETKKFFEQYPEIQAIGWNQYTPYFNDGDECVFRVGDIYFADQSVDLDDVSYAYNLDDYFFAFKKPLQWQYDNYHKWPEYVDAYENKKKELGPRFEEVCNAYEEMKKVLSDIPDEIYKEIFGDHVFILITKDGIQVNDYDHE